jgi:hypothetical protein
VHKSLLLSSLDKLHLCGLKYLSKGGTYLTPQHIYNLAGHVAGINSGSEKQRSVGTPGITYLHSHILSRGSSGMEEL